MKIVWTVPNPESLIYVRVHLESTPTRARPIKGPIANGQVVGYEVLPPTVEGRHRRFERRVFTVRSYDRCNEPEGTYKPPWMPSEAVLVSELLEAALAPSREMAQ